MKKKSFAILVALFITTLAIAYNQTGYNTGASSSGGSWGSITGTLSSQTDLQSALDAKQGTLTNSAGLAGALSDETGTGVAVFGTNPTIDASSSGLIKVLAGSNPTVSAAGAISVDTSATTGSALRFYGDAQYTIPGYYRTTLILDSPTSSSDYEVGSFPANITIRKIKVYASGGTNIVGGLQECDANGASCAAVDSDITATAGTTANDDGTLSNATIDADDQLQWLTTSVSGSVTRAVITVYYTYDAVS